MLGSRSTSVFISGSVNRLPICSGQSLLYQCSYGQESESRNKWDLQISHHCCEIVLGDICKEDLGYNLLQFPVPMCQSREELLSANNPRLTIISATTTVRIAFIPCVTDLAHFLSKSPSSKLEIYFILAITLYLIIVLLYNCNILYIITL